MSGLATLIGGSEQDNIEWKRDTSNRDGLRQAICALANDLPERGRGHLVVGVQDDGSPTGFNIDDQLILQVVNLRDEAKILPRPVLTVSKESFDGADCLLVTVEPSRIRPARLDGVVYVRVGTSTRRASREEEILLTERSRAGDVLFDQHPVEGTSIDDLDVELFRSTYLPSAIDADVLAENDPCAILVRPCEPGATPGRSWGCPRCPMTSRRRVA